MSRVVDKYKSDKSRTTYVVSEECGKNYITAEGEASTNKDVIATIADARKNQYDISTTLWIARTLSHEH